MIGLLAEMHWHPSMALGREEEVEKQLAAFVAQLYAVKEGAVCRIPPPRDDDEINNTCT